MDESLGRPPKGRSQNILQPDDSNCAAKMFNNPEKKEFDSRRLLSHQINQFISLIHNFTISLPSTICFNLVSVYFSILLSKQIVFS